MANYATNIFYACTKNEKNLDKVEIFWDDTFYDYYLDRSNDYIDGEFSSKWDYPEKEINDMPTAKELADEQRKQQYLFQKVSSTYGLPL